MTRAALFVVMLLTAGLLLVGSAACRAPAPDAGSAEPALLVTVAAQHEQIFTTWSPLPGAARHLVRWRPAGDTRWQVADAGVQTYHAITKLRNDVTYEVQIESRDRDGLSSWSDVRRTSPKPRDSCTAVDFIPGGTRVSFFCTPEALEQYIHASAIDPVALTCRQQPARLAPEAPDCLYTAPDGEQLLLLRGADDVFHPPAYYPAPAVVRQTARRAIWGTGPPPFEESAAGAWVLASGARIGQVTAHAAARSYDLAPVDGLGSRVTWFEPDAPIEGRFAIYHEGHGGAGIEIAADTIDWLLARGWTVIAADMPLIGVNADDQRADLRSHMDLAALDDGVTSPLSRFLLPVKAIVDVVTAEYGGGKPTILLIGRSGGGWTGYTYGALDPRVDLTVSIAGGRPVSARLDAPWGALELGDYEQTAPHLYNAVGHEYLMLSAGSAGAFYAFNEWDTCCFQVKPDDAFVQYLQAAPGTDRIVEVFVDTEHRGHSLGPQGYAALEKFLTRMLTDGGPRP